MRGNVRAEAPGVGPEGDREGPGTDSPTSGPVWGHCPQGTLKDTRGHLPNPQSLGRGCDGPQEEPGNGRMRGKKSRSRVCAGNWRAGERLRRLKGNPGTASISG